MPDEGSVRYGVSNCCVFRGADGKYVPVGSVSEFDITTSDDCGIPAYENIRALMEPAEPVPICGCGLTEPIEVSFEEYEWLQKLLEEE